MLKRFTARRSTSIFHKVKKYRLYRHGKTIVTIDAMGYQKDIAAKIVNDNKADYILSLRGVRGHWGIESAHWILDITFCEDANRTRKGKAPQNLALLKRIAINMVRKDQERYPKRSLRSRRFLASLKKDYLEYIFSINFR